MLTERTRLFWDALQPEATYAATRRCSERLGARGCRRLSPQVEQVGSMAEGVVKWFNSEKGYGFVTPDGGGAEVFVHYSAIQMTGYRTLDEGERVAFLTEHGPKGLQATHVTPLGPPGPPSVPPPAPKDWILRRYAGNVLDPSDRDGYSLTRVSRVPARKTYVTFDGMLDGKPWSKSFAPAVPTLRRHQRILIPMDWERCETVTMVAVRWKSGLRTKTWQTTNV